MGREQYAFVGRKVITTSLDINEKVVKMDKLADIMEMATNLDELDNTNNLEKEDSAAVYSGIM